MGSGPPRCSPSRYWSSASWPGSFGPRPSVWPSRRWSSSWPSGSSRRRAGRPRSAPATRLSWPLLSRIGACVAIGVAGGGLARSTDPGVRHVGRAISGAAGLILLYALSVNWTRYHEALRSAGRAGADFRWRTQAGLSVLWAIYAGVALAWGFVRSNPAVRYAALALLGLTVFKVFAVDFAEVKTAYRILSFVVLGVVLLLVSLAYQKRRSVPPPAES